MSEKRIPITEVKDVGNEIDFDLGEWLKEDINDLVKVTVPEDAIQKAVKKMLAEILKDGTLWFSIRGRELMIEFYICDALIARTPLLDALKDIIDGRANSDEHLLKTMSVQLCEKLVNACYEDGDEE